MIKRLLLNIKTILFLIKEKLLSIVFFSALLLSAFYILNPMPDLDLILAPGETATYSRTYEFIYEDRKYKNDPNFFRHLNVSREDAQIILEGISIKNPKGIEVIDSSFTVESPVNISRTEGGKSMKIYTSNVGCRLKLLVSVRVNENSEFGKDEIEIAHPGVKKLGNLLNADAGDIETNGFVPTEKTIINLWIFKSEEEKNARQKRDEDGTKVCIAVFVLVPFYLFVNFVLTSVRTLHSKP